MPADRYTPEKPYGRDEDLILRDLRQRADLSRLVASIGLQPQQRDTFPSGGSASEQALWLRGLGSRLTTLGLDGIALEQLRRQESDLLALRHGIEIDALLERGNAFVPHASYLEQAPFTIGGLVDASLPDAAPTDAQAASFGDEIVAEQAVGGVRRFVAFSGQPPGSSKAAVALFEPDRVTFEQRPSGQVRARLGPSPARSALAASALADGVMPASFPGEGTDHVVRTRRDQLPSDVVPDDVAYVPLSLTDLRPDRDGSQRTVYMRPFITQLGETFSPGWNDTDGFGRVDPVKVYKSVTRTIELGFVLAAFSPEDLPAIYAKLHWITAMVYPEYDDELLLKSGPTARLRVGDLVSSARRGLPGVITGLSYDYSDSTWELKRGFKVPQHVRVSLQFTVLHDAPMGVRRGQFGALSSNPDVALLDRFRGFGEPFFSTTTGDGGREAFTTPADGPGDNDIAHQPGGGGGPTWGVG